MWIVYCGWLFVRLLVDDRFYRTAEYLARSGLWKLFCNYDALSLTKCTDLIPYAHLNLVSYLLVLSLKPT
jgi:hypothetical protein